MRIGELAARTGTSVRALRYYEEQGLIEPRRTAAGQRLYRSSDERVVSTIRELFDAGFCSSVIATLLPAVSAPAASAADLEAVFDAAEARLASERRQIEQEMSALAELRTRWGLAPHVHVRGEGGSHDTSHGPEATPSDHRDRRLR
ncbi:DNA-binding transcriptional MerR regulator [Microbacterium sp. SORGH_AS428]|uniref:MerR family transcriptional regulator n=1 Tax=Microbacterium sp. SORGH_AS_0428 TaxID=3041788 RepID=UPI00285C4471|nr:MerR family transcriptional regulator [Microbacterium sp. SORGH_AS_0428]MDR6200665.1 DNA-binding transcriptional MerR regulator [Microbacterium sp. SORGH_AS_0428]